MIEKLPDDVILKIAAGEVITSPTNVLKEIIENSIDANSTQIEIIVSKNLLSLTVIDNGDGIEKADFQNVCKSHHTSKYIGNMLKIPTFGFRGEALSSISLCSKVKIESRKSESEFGYEVEYTMQEMQKIKEKGMNKGTKIVVSDIFYNNELRRKYFLNRREQQRSMYYLIANYSIFYHDLQFKFEVEGVLKEHFQSNIIIDKNIFCLNKYVKRELCVQRKMLKNIYKLETDLLEIREDTFSILFSDSAYSCFQYTFILFINGRLVHDKILKDKIKDVYKDIYPKKRFPFIYAELYIDPEIVDVNVHPAKNEILYENQINLQSEIIEKMKNKMMQTDSVSIYQSPMKNVNTQENTPAYKNIYTDPNMSSLLDICYPSQIIEKETYTHYKLEILKNYKEKIIDYKKGFTNNMVYVGNFNDKILAQSGSCLLLINEEVMLKEYFYQRLVFDFGNFSYKKINVEFKHNLTENHKNILKEYFLIEIGDSIISTVPVINNSTIVNGLQEFLLEFEKIELNDENTVFEFLFISLTRLFIKNVTMNEKFFNGMKRNIITTEDVYNNYAVLTSLNELYKLFERC